MRLFKLLKINSNIKILLSMFMISILFSCKDKQSPGIESWLWVLNPVQLDNKALSERTYTSDGRITFAKFNSDLVPYSRKQAPEVLKTYLQLPLSSQATFLRSARVGDFDHDRFQQRYKGIRVENGIYTVVSKENTIELMMGEFYQVPENFNSSPKLSEAEALSKTLKHIGSKKYIWESVEREAALKRKKNDPNASYFPKGELLVYEHSLGKSNTKKEFRLAYKFGIASIDPPISRYVYVDSNSGEILSSKDARRYEAGGGDTTPTTPPPTPPDTNYGICFPDQTPCIKQGSASTRFSGVKTITTYTAGEENHYELKDYSRGKGIITYSWEFIQEPDNTFQFLTVPIVDASNGWSKFEYHDDYNHDALLDAHWGIEMTYDYFKSVHNWLGYDGNDSKVVNNVHYIDLFVANNAFWSPITEEIYYIYCPHNSVCKTFDNSEILDPRYEDFTSLDVTSHEFGHGVNGAIAGLNYDPEPYALNEGFSDIWNIGVNNYVNKVLGMQKNLWLIADETVPGGGMRSAENPKSTTVMYPGPNTYYGDLWDFENNEPHTNSLVLSHWFYTLSKGKLGTNDHHCGYNVSGISVEKAEKIAYKSLHQLFPTAGYTSARTAAIYSAKALYGKYSSEVKSTIDAWDAVGVPADTTSRGGQGMIKPQHYISFVKLSNLERSSGNDCGYKDNSYLHPTVYQGATYNMVLSSEGSPSNPPKAHRWRVWIDFNRDGSFDFSEMVVQDSINDTLGGTLQKSIQIPTSALTGDTKMRVSMKAVEGNEGYPRFDESFVEGEVEDYSITINKFSI
ncbi:Thermolysin metallopeptidase, alpha-helical domain protein [Leptospira interrogans serovar Manilae]|uniref:Thermolysin metallopeptidase, alpha-helical domain protein n=4 Tax=Leptospira interrogans TaxID=173 RepID=A0AAQ1SP04_LEPIR|nr:M4 family metallopeptidase [Leptospira interrogans]AKP27458.1 peptidase M4 [Leptospira interrogans serovar Manilae]AKP31229.1 peptidase M4 [Leptospira interrogans serovar Manilae]SOR61762.1 Thermolysin metallopeptidase, alpha-helical domain protein [Leptospira interrogans serovar Manilae]